MSAAPFLGLLCVGVCLEVQEFLVCWDHELPEVKTSVCSRYRKDEGKEGNLADTAEPI